MAKKSTIGFRPDDEMDAILDKLVKQTGLTKSEIARRAIKHTIEKAKAEGSLGFLFNLDLSDDEEAKRKK